MAVIFPKWTNQIPVIVKAAVPLALGFIIFGIWYWFSPKFTDVGYQPQQPAAYSHKLHAGDLGLDCRYCHNTVETAAHAAVPPTATCMNCHRIIAADRASLLDIRESDANGMPVKWLRVHRLPDFAYFDHGAHLAAGVGCESCHGRVDRMRTVYQAEPLSMGWCLNCHRNPKKALRPLDKITAMGYDPVAAGYDPDSDPDRLRKVNPPTWCSGCHR